MAVVPVKTVAVKAGLENRVMAGLGRVRLSTSVALTSIHDASRSIGVGELPPFLLPEVGEPVVVGESEPVPAFRLPLVGDALVGDSVQFL